LKLPENPFNTAPVHRAPTEEPRQSRQGPDPKGSIKTKRKQTAGILDSILPENTDSLDSNSSRDTQKRKSEDMMQTFSSIPDNQLAEKKRKNYDPATLKKVSLVRKVKPCKRCGIHKIGVRQSGPSKGTVVITDATSVNLMDLVLHVSKRSGASP
jgi:hypothetical protein